MKLEEFEWCRGALGVACGVRLEVIGCVEVVVGRGRVEGR